MTSANLDVLKVVVLWSARAQIELCHLGVDPDSKLMMMVMGGNECKWTKGGDHWPYLQDRQRQGWLPPRVGQRASLDRGSSSFLAPWPGLSAIVEALKNIKIDGLTIIINSYTSVENQITSLKFVSLVGSIRRSIITCRPSSLLNPRIISRGCIWGEKVEFWFCRIDPLPFVGMTHLAWFKDLTGWQWKKRIVSEVLFVRFSFDFNLCSSKYIRSVGQTLSILG